VAGLLKMHAAGKVPSGQRIVCTVTGHGLKDPQWALRTEGGGQVEPVKVANDVVSVARVLALEPSA
jgi:threonine synthase